MISQQMNPQQINPHPSRRTLLAGGGALFSSAMIPKVASASGARDPRLVVMVLRGALDGLAAVGPIGDPLYAALHGDLAMRLDGPTPALPIDGFFALNPGMPNFARLGAREAGGDRPRHRDRVPRPLAFRRPGRARERHADAGHDRIGAGSIARSPSCPPASGSGAGAPLAVGAATPTILRGPAPVMGWEAETIPGADAELAPARARPSTPTPIRCSPPAMREGLDIERLAASAADTATLVPSMAVASPVGKLAGPRPTGMRQAAEGAARLLAASDGPAHRRVRLRRLGHARRGRRRDGTADDAARRPRFGGLRLRDRGSGPAWKETVVVAITEFGRTVHVNGTNGTDHGTGTVAFLAGGAVAGGRVVADWPGLKPAQLYEGRDLAPTTDLRAVLKGVLADHLGLSPAVLGHTVFPGTLALRPMTGLVA